MGFLSHSTSPDRMRLVSGTWNAFPVEKQMHIVSLYDKPHAKPDCRPFCVFALERVLNNLSVFPVEILLGPSELSRGLSEPGIGVPQTDRGPSAGSPRIGSGSLSDWIGVPQNCFPGSLRTGSGSFRAGSGSFRLDRGPSDWIGVPQNS